MNDLQVRRLSTGIASRVNGVRWLAVAAMVFLVCGDAAAVPIKIKVTDPNADYFASRPTCAGGAYYDCTNTAHLETTPIAGDLADFKKSFDAWNGTNAADAKWTLKNGGELPGGEFHVSKFDTWVTDPVGGVEIQIDWTYTGADKGDFKWTQGLYDNYLLNGSIVDPFYEMDVKTPCDNSDLLKQCPPLYPFQYADRFFYDRPAAPWPNAFFEANAFLAKANFTTRELTIFEGVHYGFQLDARPAPEPSTVLLLLTGVGGLGLTRARSRRKQLVGILCRAVAPHRS